MAVYFTADIPVVRYVKILVEAYNEHDAERVAIEHLAIKDIVELDCLRRIVVGNVLRGVINYIKADYL